MEMKILNLKKWIENEYEGTITLYVEGKEIACRMIANDDTWKNLEVGQNVKGNIHFLRYGEVSKTEADQYSIEPSGGIQYELTGTVHTIQGEILSIKGLPWLNIDLDFNDKIDPFWIKPGAGIKIYGQFEFDIWVGNFYRG